MTSPEKDFAEKALDTAGFAKYAAEVGDEKGIDTAKLQESLEKQDDPGKLLFETYKNLESFSNDLKSLFREDAAGIIKYEDADFKSIQNYLEANRINNPEKIAEVMRNLEQVRKDQKEIKEKEAKIAELTKKREADVKEFLKKKREGYQAVIDEGKSKEFMNVKNKTQWRNLSGLGGAWFSKGFWSEGTAKIAVEQEITNLVTDGERIAVDAGTTAGIDVEIAQLQADRVNILDRCLDVKASILQQGDFSKEIHAAAKARVNSQINSMLANKDASLGDIDAEQRRVSRINELRDSNLSFAYLEDDEAEALQKQIDAQAEKVANKEIDKALSEVNLDESNQYTKLEKSLVKLINREQLGSKGKAETKTFVVEKLKEKLEKLEKFSRAQALLLSHLIKKVETAKI